MATEKSSNEEQHASNSHESSQYLRFGAMIVTSMLVMYAVTYLNTYQLSHIAWSETRLFMTLLMSATMSIVMLGFMMGMYKNKKVNTAIVLGSVAVFLIGIFLVRSQKTVDDISYMNGMIPHHSIAILTSENAQNKDLRVCDLMKTIVEAQNKEIDEMKWLIDDIKANGYATTKSEAEKRPVPDFEGNTSRNCIDS